MGAMLSERISSKAMLVHHHQHTGMVSVTSHDVIELDSGKGFTLGAGRAFSPSGKADLVNLLLNEDTKAEFLQEKFLICSRNLLVWYRKPAPQQISFSGEAVTVPLPGLIFIAAAGQSLRCFAYKGSDRPTPDTELFYPPLGNVYREGTFCTGNANVPRDVSVQNIPAWEGFVLESDNTHQGSVMPVRKCRSFKDQIAFMRQLSEKGAKRFPARELVPYTICGATGTLGQAVERGEQ